MNDFYKFRQYLSDSAIRIYPIHEEFHDVNALLNATTPLVNKNDFKIEMGNKWNDILPWPDVGNIAISEKIKNIFEESNLTGWSCFPIIIKNYPNTKYFAFQFISKRAGKILNLKALDSYEEDRVKFDINTWDGSDFFSLTDTSIKACTPKVKEIIEKHKIKGLVFYPL